MHTIIAYPDAPSFLEACAPALLEDEPIHNLILGVAAGMSPAARSAGSFFAAWRKRRLLAAAVGSHRGLLISDTTAPGAVLLDLARALEARGNSPSRCVGPEPGIARFAQIWAKTRGVDLTPGTPQTFQALETFVDAPLHPNEQARSAQTSDQRLLTHWMTAFFAEALPNEPKPDAAALTTGLLDSDAFVILERDNQPAAMAAAIRPTQTCIALAYVYTPPEARGLGLATRVTAALVRRLLGQQWPHILLFTDANDPAPNRVYAKLGFRIQRRFGEYLLTAPT